MKYGEPTEGSDWRKIVKHVTQAAIKFDLLTTSSSSPVSIMSVTLWIILMKDNVDTHVFCTLNNLHIEKSVLRTFNIKTFNSTV